MNRYHKQCICMVLVAAIITAGAGVTGFDSHRMAHAEEYKNTEQEDAVENIVETVAGVKGLGDEGFDKEETVYVIADAEGNPTEVIASEWLKNLEGSPTIEDKTELKDIKNVKGYETYDAGKGGKITWNANGNDIYYQGTPDKKAPVSVHVSYKLNGKEISPEEIKGKSGSVEIRFDYENNSDETIEIGDETEHVSIPFTMLTGVILPNEIFSNVQVENARLVSEGNNSIVIGYAFPGLYESLKYDEFKENLDEEQREKAEDLDISDHVIITADATDFELNSTLTIALPDVLQEVSFTDNIDTDKVKDDMNELADASQELIDGTSELLDGVNDLKDGTSELKDGTSELKDGTRDIKDGTEDILSGTEDLMDGARDMKDGACEAYGGTKKLYDGTKKVKDGAGKAYDGSKTLSEGAKTLYDGSKTLYTGTGEAYKGSVSLNNGIKNAYNGSKTLNQGVNSMSTLLTSKSGDILLLEDLANTLSDQLNNEDGVSVDSGVTGSAVSDEMSDPQNILISKLFAMDAANGQAMLSVSMLSLKLGSGDEARGLSGNDIKDQMDSAAISLREAADSADEASRAALSFKEMLEARISELNENKTELETELEEIKTMEPDYSGDGQETDAAYESDSDEDDYDDPETEPETVSGDSAVSDNEAGEDEDSGDDEADHDEDDEDDGDDPEDEDGIREYYEKKLEDYRSYYEKYYSVSARLDMTEMLTEELDQLIQNIGDSAVSMNETSKSLECAADDMEDLSRAGIPESDTAVITENLVSANTLNMEAAASVRDVVVQLQKMQLLTTAYPADMAGGNPYEEMLMMDDEEVAGMLLGMDSDTLNATVKGLLEYAAKSGAETLVNKKLTSVLGTMSSSELSELASKLDQSLLNTLLGGIDSKVLAKIVAQGMSELAGALTSDETKANLAKLTAGAGALENGLGTIYQGSGSLSSGLKKLYSGIGQLNTGIGTVKKGTGTLSDGLDQLYDGTRDLKHGAGDLRDGMSELSDGGVKLYDGTVDLNDGVKDLDEGAGDLDEGALDLDDGVEELDDGVGELLDGVEELHDGMIEFNDEGIQKLIDLFGDNVTDMLDRLDAIQKTGAGYQTFSGKSDDMDGSVKFVLKTEEIKSED